MFSKGHPFFLQALSSVHAGSGSEIGIVDLPIQRERHTDYPKIESSSLKGAIRSTVTETLEANSASDTYQDVVNDVFGAIYDEGTNSHAGAIAFADARILLFPVKSMSGIFAYVTSPQVLERFNQDLRAFGQKNDQPLIVPAMNAEDDTKVSSSDVVVRDQRLVLEEYTYNCAVDQQVQDLSEQLAQLLFEDDKEQLKERLVVLPDNDFRDFTSLSTEVNPRIQIDPGSGTNTNLFYEENVPPEAIFYSYLFIGNVRNPKNPNELTPDVIYDLFKKETFMPEVFQLGGNSTLGRGMLRKVWYREDA